MYQKRNNLKSEIILILLKNPTHLREIARKLNAPPTTVLRKLGNLVEKNILDFKKEGRNKVFFIKKNLKARNYIYNVERYKLIKLLEKYPELGVIIEEVLEKSNEDMIVLFGSYAKFKAKKDSDIDIYVETKDKEAKRKLESIHSDINVKIGKFNLDSSLIKEIIKDHIILTGVEIFYERIKFFG